MNIRRASWKCCPTSENPADLLTRVKLSRSKILETKEVTKGLQTNSREAATQKPKGNKNS